jgi:hypothetical protein
MLHLLQMGIGIIPIFMVGGVGGGETIGGRCLVRPLCLSVYGGAGSGIKWGLLQYSQ